MNTKHTTTPTNKKEYISDIGRMLVKEHGKRKYYKPKEVKKVHEKSNWFETIELSHWAMCTFSSHIDFDKYHESIGETYDYAKMKTEMLSELSISSNCTEISNIDIDSSWLDFGDIFEGIGEFIGGIFDSL